MINIVVRENEILRISKIDYWFRQSIFNLLYTIILSIIVFFSYTYLLFIFFVISVPGSALAIFFYFFSIQNISINIAELNTTVDGALVPRRSRNFSIKEYTKIVLREYVGYRIEINWFCEIYVGRKYVTLFRGDKKTGLLIANCISKNLELPFEIKESDKIMKKRVYAITTWVMYLGLLIIPLMLIFLGINMKLAFTFFLIWVVLLIMIIPITVHYMSK